MTNEELLEALNKRFDAIDFRLEKIEADVEQLKEDSEITRSGVNALVEWAEDVSNAIRFPLPKLK
jgi:hypothetical protein